jgi:hypothetical protein
MFHAKGSSKGTSHSSRRIENQSEQEEVQGESRLEASQYLEVSGAQAMAPKISIISL